MGRTAIRKLVELLGVGYTLLLLYWMFRGFGRSDLGLERIQFNLIPFRTIWHYVGSVGPGNWLHPLINIGGNIGVFVPFGLLIPLWLRGCWSYPGFLYIFTAGIVVLEVAQTFLEVGTGDIDDWILNTVGGSIGYVLSRRYVSHRLDL
ncbi:VanZ family protein [Paenibacillus filicis]|uniref:VanZ family protein n=1 Tax=Paenibacillus filicis TaxID=669464 RepID=A0ABU9DVM7_9BACL